MNFLRAGCPSYHPSSIVQALKGTCATLTATNSLVSSFPQPLPDPEGRAIAVFIPALWQQYCLGVHCGLDYCNSLLYGISNGLLWRLQLVQNAAAHLVTGTGRRDHVTPMLRQLHWLPVSRRVMFKIVRLVHQSLAGAAPAYFLMTVVFCLMLVVACYGPVRTTCGSWLCRELTINSVTGVSQQPVLDCGTIFHLDYGGLSFDSFKRSLKTHLFGNWSA